MEHSTRIRWRLVGLTVALAGAVLTLPSRPAMAATARIAFTGLGPSSMVTEYVGVLLPNGEVVDFTTEVGSWYTGVCAQMFTSSGMDVTADTTFTISQNYSPYPGPPNCYLFFLADAGKTFTITGSSGAVTATGTVAAKIFRAPGNYNAGTPVQKPLRIEFNQFADQVESWLKRASVPAGRQASIRGAIGRIQIFLRIWWLYRIHWDIERMGNDLAAAGAPLALLQQLSRVAVDMRDANVLTIQPVAPGVVDFAPPGGVSLIPPWMPPVSLLSGGVFGFPAPSQPVFWFGF